MDEQYLKYEDYKALGGKLNLTSFNLLEFEAKRIIDINTFNRLKEAEDIPEEVKRCEYKLINSIDGYASSMNSISKDIKSENIDGYSVSYSDVSDIVKSKRDELNDIIRTYLLEVEYNGEHLLYRGVE